MYVYIHYRGTAVAAQNGCSGVMYQRNKNFPALMPLLDHYKRKCIKGQIVKKKKKKTGSSVQRRAFELNFFFQRTSVWQRDASRPFGRFDRGNVPVKKLLFFHTMCRCYYYNFEIHPSTRERTVVKPRSTVKRTATTAGQPRGGLCASSRSDRSASEIAVPFSLCWRPTRGYRHDCIAQTGYRSKRSEIPRDFVYNVLFFPIKSNIRTSDHARTRNT